MEQRLLSEEELRQARAMTNWTFWFAPASFTLTFLVIAWLLRGEDVALRAILEISFGGSAVVYWLLRIRAYSAINEDLGSGMVRMLEGAPERAWVSRGGFCYIRLQGLKIRVPNDEYQGIRDANIVRVAFLPKSRIAVHVEVASGIGIS